MGKKGDRYGLKICSLHEGWRGNRGELKDHREGEG
jgi:hypothetical protein